MKKYIVISSISSCIVYDYRILNIDEERYVNNDSFYKNSLFYTLNYYKKNIKKISNILKEEYEYLIVKNLVDFKYVIELFNNINSYKIRLLFNSALSIDEYNSFIECRKLIELDVYYMPEFVKLRFKENGKKVITHNNKKISEKFLLSQDSFDYDTLYYRKQLVIKEEYDGLLDDIKEFLVINRHLKSIDIYVYSRDLIEEIVRLIRNDESTDVIVLLHECSDKGLFIKNNFKWLKALNEACKKDNTCEFRIIYSKEYIKNNLFKQLTYNNLKLIFILAIYITSSMLLIYSTYRYVNKLNSDKVKLTLLNNATNEVEENDAELLNDDDIEITNEEQEVIEKSKYDLDEIFSNLTSINNETVGYLVINNTKISYPVVQHSDNSYYLKHDFYKRRASIGWVFLDYRNSGSEIDDNNIIYAHSMLDGTMFGTLKKVLDSTFRKNESNMIITYDTTNSNNKFKIFSAYKVDYTTDYLKTTFETEKEYNDYIDMIRNRSIFKNGDSIPYKTKLLTLSTCTGNSNRRLVVHAYLMEEE